MPFEDVHTRHCCILHGCKYGKEDTCTVMTKLGKQEDPCEDCMESGIQTLEELEKAMAGDIKTCPHCRHILKDETEPN